MEFNLSGPNHLTVRLSRQELSELGLSCEAVHQNPRARDILVELLEEGRAETGFHPSKAKLIVEMLPHEDGGCVISFNALPGSCLPLRHRGMRPVVFEFEDVEALVEGAEKTFARYSHRIYKSSLYLFEGRYRMVVHPLDYSDRLSIYFLSEFATKLGEDEVLAAFTEEHGQELVRDNALDLLARHFGGEREGQTPD